MTWPLPTFPTRVLTPSLSLTYRSSSSSFLPRLRSGEHHPERPPCNSLWRGASPSLGFHFLYSTYPSAVSVIYSPPPPARFPGINSSGVGIRTSPSWSTEGVTQGRAHQNQTGECTDPTCKLWEGRLGRFSAFRLTGTLSGPPNPLRRRRSTGDPVETPQEVDTEKHTAVPHALPVPPAAPRARPPLPPDTPPPPRLPSLTPAPPPRPPCARRTAGSPPVSLCVFTLMYWRSFFTARSRMPFSWDASR